MTRLKRATSASIVCSQSRKRRVLPLRAGRDDVADLDGAVGDDHAVNQQLEQCPLPFEVRLGQAHVKRWIDDLMPYVTDDSDPLGTEDFATHRVPLDQAPAMYERFQAKQDDVFKVLLQP